jgi:uncharacterized protein
MPIKVNLRTLEKHEVELEGELPVAELDLGVQDDLIQLNHPLYYQLRVEQLHDSVLVTGSLELKLDCECVRCLKSFVHRLELPDWALHLPLAGEDAVVIDNDSIDLTPYAREDMLLEFPQHPLCKTTCGGLKKKPVRAKAPGDKPPGPDAWSALDQLKLK